MQNFVDGIASCTALIIMYETPVIMCEAPSMPLINRTGQAGHGQGLRQTHSPIRCYGTSRGRYAKHAKHCPRLGAPHSS